MQVTLTHLRQNLFTLADEVLRSGEPLLIERNGALLKLVRAEPQTGLTGGRLQQLKVQALTIGAPLAPDESPSSWLQIHLAPPRAAEPAVDYEAERTELGKPVARKRKRR